MEDLESKLENEGNNRGESSGECENVSRKYNKIGKINAIEEAIKNGARNALEISHMTSINRSYVYQVAREGRIELPKGKRGRPMGSIKGTKRKPEVDELIEQGLALEVIGNKVGVTGEAIRQYINSSDQYDNWVRKRIENTGLDNRDKHFGGVNKLYELQYSFLSSVKKRIKQLVEKESFATQKAIEYLLSYKKHYDQNYSFSKLYNIFKRYEMAIKKGEKLSLEELGKEEGIFKTQIGQILNRVGLEPLFGKVKMEIKYRGERSEATIRGFYTDFSGEDIAYFLNLPGWIPRNRFKEKGKHRDKKNWSLKQFGSRSSTVHLTYSLASEMYEAEDAGFSRDEIRELTETKSEVVDYTLSERKEIEPKIIDGLKILYYGSIVRKPYVTPEMRVSLEKEEGKRNIAEKNEDQKYKMEGM
ncbi:MAG: hypothetical protein Q7S27_00925 [Nanoarchaeota archaeon]|nr:hypothetical protein [Nanoarchaeota archaeon]